MANEETQSLLSGQVSTEYGAQRAVIVDNEPVSGEPLNEIDLNPAIQCRKWPQYVAVLAANGGAFAAGCALGWTSPAERQLVTDNMVGIGNGNGTAIYPFDISTAQFSWISAVLTLGAASICMPIGFLINRIGRKYTMLCLVGPFAIGWALIIGAQTIAMMYVGRLLLGIASGGFCVAAPIYAGEIADEDIRGVLGSFFQLMVTVGILFVYTIGALVDVREVSLICGIVPLIFGTVFAFMPETPRYWISVDRRDRAAQSIEWLRGSDTNVNAELQQLQRDHDDNQHSQVSLSLVAAFQRPATRRAFRILTGLMIFQQMCGVNAIIFYTKNIFEQAHVASSPDIATIIVGTVQVLTTFTSAMIVDRTGRRSLLLTSNAFMALCTATMAIYSLLNANHSQFVSALGWLPICALCLFIVMFSLGFGPVPWIMAGELFDTNVKGVASAIAGTLNWSLAFVVTKTFASVDPAATYILFFVFTAFSIVGTIFVYYRVPETRGKTLAEIQQLLD